MVYNQAISQIYELFTKNSTLGTFLALGVIAGIAALFATCSSIIKSKQITKNKIEQFEKGDNSIYKFSLLEYSLNPLIRFYVKSYIEEIESNAKSKEETESLERELAKMKAMSNVEDILKKGENEKN